MLDSYLKGVTYCNYNQKYDVYLVMAERDREACVTESVAIAVDWK